MTFSDRDKFIVACSIFMTSNISNANNDTKSQSSQI